MFVAHCERDRRIRLISSRPATRSERKEFEEGFVVLIDSDFTKIFPDSAAVNRTLRVVAEAAQAIAQAKRRSRAR